MLYPQDNAVRETKSLDGIWRFAVDDGSGLEGRRFEKPLSGSVPMPVPASYNDLTENPAVRNHVGYVWYERDLFVPAGWADRRVVLRFGSATHAAVVWINGAEVCRHHGGFTPFEVEIGPALIARAANRLTVAVNNELGFDTVPVGRVETKMGDPGFPDGFKKLTCLFDFFNYSGLHRSVVLYSTNRRRIEDISIVANPDTGSVEYTVRVSNNAAGLAVRVSALAGAASGVDGTSAENLEEVATSDPTTVPAADASALTITGALEVTRPALWQPGAPNLYTLRVDLGDDDELFDRYDETFGFRSIEVRDGAFLINGKPFYFKGFGKHEDAEFSGRGFNPAVLVKDFSLMKWMGANSFRTSHYPYAEEVLRLADREGFVVIDEAPAVGLELGLMQLFGVGGPKLNTWEELNCGEAHRQALTEMIDRDKNHPCVVMWSVANEPAASDEGAREYFEPLVHLTRERDPQARPVTIVQHLGSNPQSTLLTGLCDVITLNRYYGWYVQPGHLETVAGYLGRELQGWWQLEGKPVLMTEYGADALHGLSSTVPTMWTEEFQEAFLEAYHRVFDSMPFFAGEHVWNFADFQTGEGLIRVDGNKKGVFTRDRKPKRAARLLRTRWLGIPDFGYKG